LNIIIAIIEALKGGGAGAQLVLIEAWENIRDGILNIVGGIVVAVSSDFDPGNLIPKTDPADGRPLVERMIEHVKSFGFYVVPNSMLDIAQVERKLLYLTLRRMGEIDHVTLLKTLDIPDIEGINQRLTSEIDQKIAMAAGVDPAQGRPPTAQKMPKLEQRGGRPIVSESG